MRLASLPTGTHAIQSAKRRAFAAMKTSIETSNTCSAYRAESESLDAENVHRIAPLSRTTLADWTSEGVEPNRITTGDLQLVLRSSGSSGSIRTVRHSAGFNAQVHFLGARGLAMEGLSPNPVVANALLAGDLFGGFGFAERALTSRGAAVLPAGSTMPLRFLADLIRQEAAEAVVGVPGHLARLVEEHSDALGSLRTVFYLGDRPRPELREALGDRGVALRSLALSTTETGPIGFQCEFLSGGDHHVHEDLVHVEIVDDEGEQSRLGEVGDVLVTPLVDSGLALVRYRVGDRGALVGRGCPCGTSAQVLRLGGREGTSINVRGTLITESMVRSALGTTSGELQVGVLEDADAFRLEVLLLFGTDATSSELARALAAEPTLMKVFGTEGFKGVDVRTAATAVLDRRGKQQFFYRGELQR